MNKKLSLADLAEILSENQEISEDFLREFINVLVKNLKEDGAVKLKNFGVFKVVKVGERESVDVNTGEKIIISAHQKITFSPDKKLKDAVNKPFSVFEPVLLEEGVEIDMSDADEGVVPAIEDVVQNENNNNWVEDGKSSITPTDESPKQTFVINDKPVIIMPKSERRRENLLYIACVCAVLLIAGGFYYFVIRGSDVQLEDATILQPDSALLMEEDSLSAENPYFAQENGTEPKNSNEQQQEMSVVEKAKQERLQQLAQEDAAKRAQAAEERAKLMEERNRISRGSKSDATVKQEQPTPEVKPTSAELQSKPASAPKAQSSESVTQPPKSVAAFKQNSQTSAVTTAKAESKPAVSGQAKSVVVKSGDTFRTLALQHYGSKEFWGYIYQANKAKVANPNSLSQGVTLVIPSATSLGIDANNASSVSKAKALGAKLMNGQ